MLGTRYVVISTSHRPLTAQSRSNRYNVEPFFFSSSINWIPSRYRASFFNLILPPTISSPTTTGKSYYQNRRPCVSMHPYEIPFILNSPIDITVTLNSIRIVNQSSPVNTSARSTLVDKPKTFISRLKSALSVVSLWSFFANQIEEIGNIDTLAPMYLRSSTI